PDAKYRIQLFSNQTCNSSGFGEGETLLDDFFVSTDDNCNASFDRFVSAVDAPAGRFITATATDPDGNTSEFSACEIVVAPVIGTKIRLIEGPIHVAPGVPVEFGFNVETVPPGQTGDFSGVVVVSDDQGDVCRAEVSGTGEGACPLTFSTPGTHLVRGHYLGNATFEESTSPPMPVLVGMPGGRP
ncbi:MAG TPA: Ig-like domain-containing protein, partial [Thermoanaerobaculia bacterium]